MLKNDKLSEFDRNALLAQLKAAKVRLALEEQRRRRAAERKRAIRLGNQQLALKLLGDEETEVSASARDKRPRLCPCLLVVCCKLRLSDSLMLFACAVYLHVLCIASCCALRAHTLSNILHIERKDTVVLHWWSPCAR